MSRFILDTERIAVRDGDDVIYRRRKMDYGTQQDVQSAGTRVTFDEAGKPRTVFDVGQYQKALLQHNILGWEGPGFAGFPCTPENILKLDPTDALVARTLEEISAANLPTTDAEAKKSTPAGDASLTAS